MTFFAQDMNSEEESEPFASYFFEVETNGFR